MDAAGTKINIFHNIKLKLGTHLASTSANDLENSDNANIKAVLI